MENAVNLKIHAYIRSHHLSPSAMQRDSADRWIYINIYFPVFISSFHYYYYWYSWYTYGELSAIKWHPYVSVVGRRSCAAACSTLAVNICSREKCMCVLGIGAEFWLSGRLYQRHFSPVHLSTPCGPIGWDRRTDVEHMYLGVSVSNERNNKMML